MFVVDDSLEGIKVQHRPSMLKYQASGISSGELHNTVEIKQWDAPPPSGSLCQTSIQMLEERGVPRDGEVIKGWDIGLQDMRVGGTRPHDTS